MLVSMQGEGPARRASPAFIHIHMRVVTQCKPGLAGALQVAVSSTLAVRYPLVSPRLSLGPAPHPLHRCTKAACNAGAGCTRHSRGTARLAMGSTMERDDVTRCSSMQMLPGYHARAALPCRCCVLHAVVTSIHMVPGCLAAACPVTEDSEWRVLQAHAAGPQSQDSVAPEKRQVR